MKVWLVGIADYDWCDIEGVYLFEHIAEAKRQQLEAADTDEIQKYYYVSEHEVSEEGP